VQALLGPWTETRSGDSRGTLRDLNLQDFIPLQGVSGANAILEIEAEGERTGELHFADGQICHAAASGLSGMSALHAMLRWGNTRGKETERELDAPRTIQGPWQHNFREALRATKPRAEDRPAPAPPPDVVPAPSAVSENGKPVKPTARTGKKIVVIDDTEMLLIFVEDVLSTADPSLQIVTAFTGGEGARRAEVMIPDLVLLDYSLPDLRGDQVCERLLQNEATARIPIVMMSGHVVEMMATAERYRNVVATIAKPFMSEALVALVRATLAKGPLAPDISPKDKPAVQTHEEPPPVTAEEPKTVRHGNGKKPIKKSGAAKSEPQVVQSPPSQPATPTPASEVKEPVAVASPPPAPVSSISIAREIRPAEPALLEPPQVLFRPSPTAPVASSNGGAVLLGLGMEVISVQFTPRFQVGTIRAKPSATTLSLTQLLGASGAESFWGPGFELGMVELDPRGQIRTMRVLPTRRPADSIRPHNGFDINQVKLVNDQACIQLISGTAAPMTMQLVAMFKVAAVELSDRFEVAQLVLQPEGSRVRITLDPQSRGAAATEFDTVRVHLDSSARIAEFVLNSAAA
jgi:CheY-like chemotaxis protein